MKLMSSGAKNRGVALIMALFLVVLLLMVAIAVLASSMSAASGSFSVQTKNETFDAAEAGLQVAQYTIDENKSVPNGANGSGTVSNGYSYTYNWQILVNNLNGVSSTNATDPATGNTIVVNPNEAYLVADASAPTGGRTVHIEEMVIPGTPGQPPGGAITCGGTGQINHQQITDTSGNHSGHIRCKTITSNGGGQIPDGNSYASGTSNAITGYDGFAHINMTPASFYTAGELAALQTSVLNQATKSGPPNYYTAGNITGTTTIGALGNCVAYIGGNITMNGNGTITNYCQTTVVEGNVFIGGNATYSVLPTSQTHMMFVFGTGGAVLHGSPTSQGIVYAANGSIILNGSGNGSFTGSLITPYNVTMNGGGNSGFNYNGLQTPQPLPNPVVAPMSQWEY